MKFETQKLTIERLLSSPDIFTRCSGIISPGYFDPEFRSVVKFIIEYGEKYNALPKLDYVNTEHDFDFKLRTIDKSDIEFTCNEIESFCQQSALFQAIMDSGVDITSGDKANYGRVLDRVQKALAVSIQVDLGIDVYEDIESRLATYLDTDIYEPTGITGLDEALGGGLSRQQVTMFSANSGGGKSLMMSNIIANYSRRGLHVVQIALELTEQLIDLRNISILTGVDTETWKEQIPQIANVINSHKSAGAGSFVIKRISSGSTANDIRSYLKLYESERGHKPDVIVVDYLDIMHPNGGVKDKGISEQDKEKAEQLEAIAFDYDAILLTASQQNRDGVRNNSPDQAIIAGGITKINTAHNYISIYMNPEMRLKGELFLYYLKTRSSSAVGSMTQLAFNANNLIISDTLTTTVSVINSIRNRVKVQQPIIFPGVEGDVQIPDEFADIIGDYHRREDEDLLGDVVTAIIEAGKSHPKPETLNMEDDQELWEKPKKFKLTQTMNHDELINLMNSIQG